MKKLFLIALVALQGCVTVNIEATKSVVAEVDKGQTQAAVEGHAQTVCKDYVFFQKCLLYLDLHQVKSGDTAKP